MLPAGKHVGRAFSCLPLLMLITAISGKKKFVSGANNVDRHSSQTRYYMTAFIDFSCVSQA